MWKDDCRQKEQQGQRPWGRKESINPKDSRRLVWLELKEQLGKLLNENGEHAGKSCEEFCCNQEQRNLAGAEAHMSSAEGVSAWFSF